MNLWYYSDFLHDFFFNIFFLSNALNIKHAYYLVAKVKCYLAARNSPLKREV